MGASGRRFESYHPDLYFTYLIMEIHSVEYWQENWDELMERVEKGESIGVTNGKDTAIMMPADDEVIRMYRDHEEGS